MEEGLHINPTVLNVEEIYRSALNDGRVYVVLSPDGKLRRLTREEVEEFVFKSHGGTLPDLDYSALEQRYLALLSGGIRGRKADQIIVDEIAQLQDETEVIPNKPHIKSNNRTKRRSTRCLSILVPREGIND